MLKIYVYFQGEAGIIAHVKATKKIIDFMENSDKENSDMGPSQPPASYTANSYTSNYYQTSPQDMSLSNLNYSNNHSTSSSDRLSSSMEVDGYHWNSNALPPSTMDGKKIVSVFIQLFCELMR